MIASRILLKISLFEKEKIASNFLENHSLPVNMHQV